MMRIFALGLAAMFLATIAFGQSDVADNTPQENVSGSAVAERAPGEVVQSAIERHRQLQQERLKGEGGDDTEEDTTSGTTSTSSLSDLLDLAGGLTGGSLSSLTSLLGTTTSGSGLTSDQIYEMIQQSLANQTGSTSKPLSSKSTIIEGALTTKTSLDSKTETRAQTSSSSSELKFRQRWLNTMLATFFTSLTLGLQSDDLIDALSEGIQNLIAPISSNNGDSSGSSSGEGVEDVDGDGNTDGASDSVVFLPAGASGCC